MTIEIFIIGLLLIAATGVVGFYVGRGGSAERARIAVLEAELTETEKKLSERQAGIDEHFEESAELFGRLAQDYRALFQHFASDAAKLGLGDARSQQILDTVRARLLTDERSIETVEPTTTVDSSGAAEARDAVEPAAVMEPDEVVAVAEPVSAPQSVSTEAATEAESVAPVDQAGAQRDLPEPTEQSERTEPAAERSHQARVADVSIDVDGDVEDVDEDVEDVDENVEDADEDVEDVDEDVEDVDEDVKDAEKDVEQKTTEDRAAG